MSAKKPPPQRPDRGTPAAPRRPVPSREFVEAEATQLSASPFAEPIPEDFAEDGPNTEPAAPLPFATTLDSAAEEVTPRTPVPALPAAARTPVLRASPVKERSSAARPPPVEPPPEPPPAEAPRRLRLPKPGEVISAPESPGPTAEARRAAPEERPRRPTRPPEEEPRRVKDPAGEDRPPAAAVAPDPTPTRGVLLAITGVVLLVAVGFGLLAKRPGSVPVVLEARPEPTAEGAAAAPPPPARTGVLAWFRESAPPEEAPVPAPAPAKAARKTEAGSQVVLGEVPVRRNLGPRTMWMRLPEERPVYGYEPVEERPPPRDYDSEKWPTGEEPARLFVFSDPPGVRVSVDGALWGVTPLVRGVAPDAKRLRVTLGGGGLYPEKTVDVTRGPNNRFEVGVKMDVRPRDLPKPDPSRPRWEGSAVPSPQ